MSDNIPQPHVCCTEEMREGFISNIGEEEQQVYEEMSSEHPDVARVTEIAKNKNCRYIVFNTSFHQIPEDLTEYGYEKDCCDRRRICGVFQNRIIARGSRKAERTVWIGIKTFFRTSDWESVGVAAFYGYFAINILMKALAYDHGDNIYKFFFIFAMSFWASRL